MPELRAERPWRVQGDPKRDIWSHRVPRPHLYPQLQTSRYLSDVPQSPWTHHFLLVSPLLNPTWWVLVRQRAEVKWSEVNRSAVLFRVSVNGWVQLFGEVSVLKTNKTKKTNTTPKQPPQQNQKSSTKQSPNQPNKQQKSPNPHKNTTKPQPPPPHKIRKCRDFSFAIVLVHVFSF